MFRGLLITILLFHTIIAAAQRPTQGKDSSAPKLKVFIDCRGDCDEQFIRSEIAIIDFVIDRLAADAHVLLTSQPVGSGGDQYELKVYGQNDFSHFIDTLRFTSKPNASDAEVREGLLQYIMLGLTPLLAKTSFANEIRISMKGEEDAVEVAPDTTATKDKWNYWVFTAALTGEFNADQVYKTGIWGTEVSANRTTDKLKVTFSTFSSLNNTVYTYAQNDTNTTYRVKNEEYGVFHSLVKSVSGHWSAGYQAKVFNNTFANIKRTVYFNPAVEFNFFDFKEVNDRFLVLRYGIDITSNRYYDTTVLDRRSETLMGHRLSATLTLNKKFGTINTGIYYREFFRNRKLNSMGMNANADIKISGAFSFTINIDASVLHDQINLVKAGATDKEVFTRKRQIASTFNYQSSVGINFRFGSILNNFVNPRFEGYAGF